MDRPEGKKFEFFRPTAKFYDKIAVMEIDQMVGRGGDAKKTVQSEFDLPLIRNISHEALGVKV